MRIGIVGLGRAGGIHVAAGRAEQSIEVIAGCDPSAEARSAAAGADWRIYSDLAQMLTQESLDGAVVCSPPADHGALTMACLAKGLHVLCEKPLAIGLGEARRMFRVAATHGRMLVVASKFRQVDAVRAAREVIRGGDIGEPLNFAVTFCTAIDMTSRWNAQPRRSGGGVIADNGAHVFDLVGYLFGPVSRVHAARLRAFQPLAVEDSACLRIEAGGVVGNADLSWSWNCPDDRYLLVHGSDGTLEIGWHGARVRAGGGSWRRLAGPYDKLAAHRRMHARFAACACDHGAPWIEQHDCLRSVAAVEAAYRSLLTGAWETVDVTIAAPAGRLARAVPAAPRPAQIAS